MSVHGEQKPDDDREWLQDVQSSDAEDWHEDFADVSIHSEREPTSCSVRFVRCVQRGVEPEQDGLMMDVEDFLDNGTN